MSWLNLRHLKIHFWQQVKMVRYTGLHKNLNSICRVWWINWRKNTCHLVKKTNHQNYYHKLYYDFDVSLCETFYHHQLKQKNNHLLFSMRKWNNPLKFQANKNKNKIRVKIYLHNLISSRLHCAFSLSEFAVVDSSSPFWLSLGLLDLPLYNLPIQFSVSASTTCVQSRSH